ncbi:unnamed protein product [Linum tenue]|uniref:BHLH domain-containing protein n=1 Tax=Linum tenue TaxID=586396 RepID=A0AAV0LR68_9ROSI|nr:unnamed protein product [Linum tenue]
MEPANLHHHHHRQLQVVASSSSSSSSSSSPPNPPSAATAATTTASTSYYGAAPTTGGGGGGWTQNFTLLMINNNHHHDLSFQWNINSGCFTSIKDVVDEGGCSSTSLSSSTTSSDPFPRFTDMLISSADETSSSSANDLSEKLLLKTISGFPAYNYHGGGGGGVMPFNNSSNFGSNRDYFMLPAARVGGSGSATTTASSFIYPSINVSSLSQQTAPLDMNMQALDLLTSSSNHSLIGSDMRVDHHHHPNYGSVDDNHRHHQENLMMRQYCCPSNDTKVSSGSSSTASFNKETTTKSAPPPTTEAKRSSSGSSPSNDATAGKSTSTQQQGSSGGANKKSRLDQPRASCPPFKVRKEKLGDRIAALQQMVAPFGKTDTASVLMEAIGYIKFLQNQVETLSVPYMKPTRSKPNRPMHFQTGEILGNGEPTNRDLRSRGLCLVPLSCMSYVASIDGGSIAGAMWPPPPPNFGGGTFN